MMKQPTLRAARARSTTTRCIVAFAGALALTAPSLPAMAQQAAPSKDQVKEAGTRFKKGLDLFKDGDYQAALIEFRRAYELAPNYNVLYNIGQSTSSSRTTRTRSRRSSATSARAGRTSPPRATPTSTRTSRSSSRRAWRTSRSSRPCGRRVTIDDIAVGKTPFAKPIMVSAGKHKITVSKTGFTATTKIVEMRELRDAEGCRSTRSRWRSRLRPPRPWRRRRRPRPSTCRRPRLPRLSPRRLRRGACPCPAS